MSDALPPPDSLDLPATRALAAAYAAEVAQGIAEGAAWSAAVEAFGCLHPAWPKPMVEREAARVIGGLAMLKLSREQPGLQLRISPPSRGLRLALVTPWLPEDTQDEAREADERQEVFDFIRSPEEAQEPHDETPEPSSMQAADPPVTGGGFRTFVLRWWGAMGAMENRHRC
ncbi:hypothetical protein [Roseomonas elaeocarpi]|uniref:Uncharacterized protein n=1 Tax=Roseomonas elaeocarpi TaxID=907779 RepID=A0ABV6JZG5_9PROT